ncbi:Ion channel protein [Streptomyces cellostaticus]|uniref:Ion channel protein n=1 Tax=Streptomyces cellostaticus TaxID=67285 RepID=A0A101NL24_9ACTN|nr:potassium channel family protein [Streptomyces cellostaticus]KUM94846.1 Ion channel protein [Streptomyces cellostaticus]GHI06340.1 NAD-binding protein of Kef-type K+ transporter [Streptomyces cellostaticus]
MSAPQQPGSDRTRLPILRSLRYWSRAEEGQSVKLPVGDTVPPLQQVLRRLALSLLVLALTTLLVWLDRTGYRDSADGKVDLADSAYYATVTLSTTGYGDVTPVTHAARLTNIERWRARIRDHAVVVGYGTKGRHAVETLLGRGTPKNRIVVVDPQKKAVDAAGGDGLVSVQGDATRTETLRRAEVHRAAQVIVAPQRDDTATLVTLTARQLNKRASIVVAVREDENVPLLKQSGADAVITSSSSAGRLLGVAMSSPHSADVLEDLMTYGSGLDLVERPVSTDEVGHSPRHSADLVVAVVRGKEVLDYTDPRAETLRPGDRLITIRRAVPHH